MKIIHCADLHLDSKMNAHLSKEQAKERKGELLQTFSHMIDIAAAEGVKAILIAGDMFDTRNISATARNHVIKAIEDNSDILFYYLKGNHDSDNFLSSMESIPDNLKLFSDSWTSYELGNVVISGLELCGENSLSAYSSLVLNEAKINIVMLHGQESESDSKDKAEIINIKGLKNKGIDYLALGHIHAFKKAQLDARGTYCYCGCLEGRGFDECGEHGFVMLDIDETTGKVDSVFRTIAQRRIYEVEVNVSGANTSAEIADRIDVALKDEGCEPTSLVKVVLCGAIDVECEKDTAYLLAFFKNRFYYARLVDKTTLKIDYETYMLDESLKGEYVRMIMADMELSDEDKTNIIRYGLQALSNEEVQ